jgi:hypothetical protein
MKFESGGWNMKTVEGALALDDTWLDGGAGEDYDSALFAPDSVTGALYHGWRSARSFFGYHPSVLKSGIQKYARRADVQKGLWCLMEMDLFSLLEWDGPALDAYLKAHPGATREQVKAQARKIRTNMVNRLVVVMSEEVGICAWWMPIVIRRLYQGWVGNRGNPASRKYLVDMYLCLASQRMARLISDIHSVYLVPPSYVKPRHVQGLLEIHRSIQARYPQVYARQAEIGSLSWSVDLPGGSPGVRECLEGIIYNIEAGCDHAFYWVRRLYDLVPRPGRYVRMVWGLLERFIDQNPGYELARPATGALQAFYSRMTHAEKPIYLYHALLLLLRRNEIDWSSQPPAIDTPISEVERLYVDHFQGGRMEIDDYVMDLHTRRMKWHPGCLEEFAREGALVKNEDSRLVTPAYREIYLRLKQELDRYHANGGRRQ